MNAKRILFPVILLTIFSNNFYAMNKDNFYKMTNWRTSGLWQMSYPSIKETSKKDQREAWYTLNGHPNNPYIAEPLCTISNIPFFLAAYAVKDSHPLSAAALTFAGSASAISHIIPYQFLNNIDKVGALTSVAAVAYDIQMYNGATLSASLHNPTVLASLLAVGSIKLADIWAARSKQIVNNSNGLLPQKMIVQRRTEHVWIHVLWHVLAAWAAYAVLTASY